MEEIIKFIKKKIAVNKLPGKASQRKMSPRLPNGVLPPRYKKRPDTRVSSVLVLLSPSSNPARNKRERDVEVLLTLRSQNVAHHRGQISFPGGKNEPGETNAETALREAREEVDLHPAAVQILGELTGLYVYKSNNFVYPIVGYSPQKPNISIDKNEVQEAFFVRLGDLTHDQYKTREIWEISNQQLEVPYWNIHDTPLWGATAMMLSELVDLYKDFVNMNERRSLGADFCRYLMFFCLRSLVIHASSILNFTTQNSGKIYLTQIIQQNLSRLIREPAPTDSGKFMYEYLPMFWLRVFVPGVSREQIFYRAPRCKAPF